MANTPISRQSKRLGAPEIGIIVFGLVLFGLIFFLEYMYSNKHGDLIGSIFYAYPFPVLLTVGLLFLVRRSAESHLTLIPWYQQQSILMGILFLSISLMSLIILINSLTHNGVPDVIGLPIIIIGALLELFIIVRLIMIRNSKTGTV